MGSPVTLSGFNNIDFSVVLNAIMQQERLPVTELQSQRSAFESQRTGFSTLASKLAALESAAAQLRGGMAFSGTTTSVSDPTALSVSTGGATPTGAFEVVVSRLARAQVTATSSSHADKDTTVVASGGSISIGGTVIQITGSVTLQGLADAINAAPGVGVTASVVQNGGAFQLVLTGKATGQANAFSITNSLTGGSGVAFAATNARDARDAEITVNGITATSATNTFEGVVPGGTVTALKEASGNPVTILITGDLSGVKDQVHTFVTAYNDLALFVSQQTASTQANSIGRDPLVRSLRSALSGVLTRQYSVGGSVSGLSEIGFQFSRTGELTFNDADLDTALASRKLDVEKLFTDANGVFTALASAVEQYTEAGGLVPNAQTRLTAQVQQVSKRIDALEARLEIRRQALQEEFIAADLAISQLNQQLGQLNSLGGQYQLF